mgnify:CR=1 FL=1
MKKFFHHHLNLVDKLNNALTKEIKSVDEAKQNNAELVKVRNQLNESTEEGAKQIAAINEKMDANNVKINESSSSLEKQFQNIGNYPGILGKVSGGLGGVGRSLSSTQGVRSGREYSTATSVQT